MLPKTIEMITGRGRQILFEYTEPIRNSAGRLGVESVCAGLVSPGGALGGGGRMGVSDRAVRRAIREGADTPRLVARACRAGTGCGGCRPLLRRLIDEEQRRTQRSVSAVLGELAPTR